VVAEGVDGPGRGKGREGGEGDGGGLPVDEPGDQAAGEDEQGHLGQQRALAPGLVQGVAAGQIETDEQKGDDGRGPGSKGGDGQIGRHHADQVGRDQQAVFKREIHRFIRATNSFLYMGE